MRLLLLSGMMLDWSFVLVVIVEMFWLRLVVLLSELCVLEIVFVEVCRLGVVIFFV